MRVEFLTDLEVVKLEGGRWKLLAPLRVLLPVEAVADVGAWLPENARAVPGGWELRVPSAYETDFASVPRVPLAFWLAGDRAHRAAVLHDWLYEHQAPRAWADRVFRAAMQAERVPGWCRWLMWLGVRLAGRASYAARTVEEGAP